MKIVTEEAAPVTRVRRSVPPNVAAAVGKALAKLPADRFATAKEFAEALTDPMFADPAGSPVRTSRWKPALVGGILVGILAGAAGGRMLSPRAGVATAEASREQVTFHGRAQRPAIAPAGDYLAYVDTRCEHAGVGRCRSALVVQEPGSTQPRTLIADALSLDTPRWTHDGRTVIVAGQLDGEREGLFAVSRLSATAQLIGPRGAYDTHPAGDTVLVVPARRGDAGIGLLISLPGGSVVDSIPLPFGAVTDVSWSPDGRHLAANTGRRLQIVDRSGRRTADLPTSTRATIRWTTTGRGLLYFRTGPVREDQFVRLPVDREGRIDGPATIVLDRIATLYRGEFDIARGTGRMLIGTGDATTDLWSFDLGARPVTGRRETRGTTWFGNPELSADGRLLYYYRGDALGDNVYSLDRTTDRETALTVQRLPGGSALRLAADGKRLAYVHTTEATARLEVITLPSGRISGVAADIDDYLVVPVPPGGYLAQSGSGVLQVADSLGGRWRALGIPDSLRITRFDLSPEGTRAAFVATANDISFAPGSDRTPNGRRVLLVGVASLAGDTVRMIRQLDAEEASPSIGWSRDGTINLGRWLAADEGPSLWRLSPTDGRLDRTADLPVGCRPDSIRLSADGRTGTCTAEDFRSDVWFVGAEETRR